MRQIAGPSFTLTNLFDIPVKIHWTFGLLVLFVGYFAISSGLSFVEISIFSSYVFCLFIFVIMHEYGHALAAKKYGIRTRDIIISPIGGVARLESMPENPRHELVVAIAGPMVNVFCFSVLFILQLLLGGKLLPTVSDLNLSASGSDFIHLLMLINGTLVVFNMIPAFPMDGGRVLRAFTTILTNDRVKATKIASTIGQVIALCFITYGFYFDHYALVFIGLFVIITARQEYQQILLQEKLRNTRLEDIVRSDFPILQKEDTIDTLLTSKATKSYLVVNEYDHVIGVLPPVLLDALAKEDKKNILASSFMLTSIGQLADSTSLMTAFQAMNHYGWVLTSVFDQNNQVKGWVSREMINEFVNQKP